jgi:hypothetical protein
MMPGSVAIRTIRVEKYFADDKYVRSNYARDKILDTFLNDRRDEVKKQREGLSLAPLFAKPRPLWAAKAFCGYFGDSMIENTSLEGADSLAWSFLFLNFTVDKMIQQPILQNEASGFDGQQRGIVSDIAYAMRQSIPIFRQFLKLVSGPRQSENDLMYFLKKIKRQIEDLRHGNSLLLPAMVEGQEILLMVEKSDDRYYRFVVIQTNPTMGLNYHAVSSDCGRLRYRTCLVLSNITNKNAIDNVFWMALYSMAISTTIGDMKRFYDVILPFLTNKPLELSLVEAEKSAKRTTEIL